ncbi:MAG: adenylate kinase [Saprospiraceae bacterium]
MINIILFGPPGSGKGTQAAKLTEKYGFLHISTGDLFRYEMSHDTPLGLKAKEYMSKGQLVPDEVTIGMLINKVNANPEAKGIIFDGFPRTIAQAEAFDQFLQAQNTAVTTLISIELSDDEIVERILHRGKTSGRSDDNDESIIRNRIEVYNTETSPVYTHYDHMGKSKRISGSGTIEEIFNRLVEVIDLSYCLVNTPSY